MQKGLCDKPSARYIWRNYKYQARMRGVSFDLPFEIFYFIAKSNCYLCGKKPSNRGVFYNGKKYPPFIYNGIDRVNNKRGYEYGNVEPCCSMCNRIKSDFESKDLLKHIIKMVRSLRRRAKL